MKALNENTNPTWYGTIRTMFTSTDVTHMRSQGFDLSSYTFVKDHAAEIYQQVATGNMPPGNPWSKEYVETFYYWMKNDYPKGNPIPTSDFLQKDLKTRGLRIRKNINSLKTGELDLLKKAFSGIMAKPTSDSNSYFAQAGNHWLPYPNTYCMHHVPGYNPWHRAYLLSFENALRSVPGCETVTLPYWDITTPFPETLKVAPFASYTLPEDVGQGFDKGYTTSRYDYPTIQANLIKNDVDGDITRAMSSTDWEDFHGYFAGAPYNTIIAGHDSGHNSTGPTMSNQSIAAFDPIFWFFHANWDRLFWEWQQKMQATDLNGLLSTINKKTDPLSYQTFTDPVVGKLTPFSQTAADIIDSINALNVDYENLVDSKEPNMLAKTKGSTLASDKFFVRTHLANVRIKGLNRLKIPGSFNVHLLKDGEVIASRGFFQPSEVEKCENCVSNAIVHFDFELPLEKVSNGKLSIWVEPLDHALFGDHFPHKMMGNPTVNVRLLLSTEQ
jgi:hypothetical protein